MRCVAGVLSSRLGCLELERRTGLRRLVLSGTASQAGVKRGKEEVRRPGRQTCAGGGWWCVRAGKGLSGPSCRSQNSTGCIGRAAHGADFYRHLLLIETFGSQFLLPLSLRQPLARALRG